MNDTWHIYTHTPLSSLSHLYNPSLLLPILWLFAGEGFDWMQIPIPSPASYNCFHSIVIFCIYCITAILFLTLMKRTACLLYARNPWVIVYQKLFKVQPQILLFKPTFTLFPVFPANNGGEGSPLTPPHTFAFLVGKYTRPPPRKSFRDI